MRSQDASGPRSGWVRAAACGNTDPELFDDAPTAAGIAYCARSEAIAATSGRYRKPLCLDQPGRGPYQGHRTAQPRVPGYGCLRRQVACPEVSNFDHPARVVTRNGPAEEVAASRAGRP
jgi:hypothetical protein